MLHVFSQYVSPKALLLLMSESFITASSLTCAAKLRFWNDMRAFAGALLWVERDEQVRSDSLLCIDPTQNWLEGMESVARRSVQ